MGVRRSLNPLDPVSGGELTRTAIENIVDDRSDRIGAEAIVVMKMKYDVAGPQEREKRKNSSGRK